ncbi:MAG: replication initiator protein A [Anaeroplasmataceae bacterium]|nr:replication initiator protein A [Anaeroplasmataceae bacterium]
MVKLDLDNFKLNESEQYAFYRIPKLLFSATFKDISTDAKVLYGLFLDRMSLSRKNDWCDENGDVYIYFSVEEIMETINAGNQKVAKLTKELDEIGLIESKRQGLGKPNKLYIKNFASLNLKCENHISGYVKTEFPEIGKSHKNNTNKSNINLAKDDKKINDISDVFTPAEIDFKATSYENVKNIRDALDAKGLNTARYNLLHPFVKKLYFEKYFSEEECIVITDLLAEINKEYDFADIAKGFSYSLSKLKQNKKVINKLAYFIAILPKNIDIVVANKTKESTNIKAVLYDIFSYNEV